MLGRLGSGISPACLKTLRFKRFNPYTNKRILGAKVRGTNNGKGTCTEYSVTRSRTEVSSQFIVSKVVAIQCISCMHVNRYSHIHLTILSSSFTFSPMSLQCFSAYHISERV